VCIVCVNHFAVSKVIVANLHLGIIGFGNIAHELTSILGRALPQKISSVSVLVREGTLTERLDTATVACEKIAEDCFVSDSVSDFANRFDTTEPKIVIECAGHSAVRSHVPALLAKGIDTIVTSVGALANQDLFGALNRAAEENGARIIIPSGAIGALDILSAIKHSEVSSVVYRSRKPPIAWVGTPAEQFVNLDALTQATTFYEGDARSAATDYPKNANVAAALALAGVGFTNTQVQLIADPDVDCNIHEFSIESTAADVAVRIEGKPSPNNPKTSLPTVYSLVREVLNRCQVMVV